MTPPELSPLDEHNRELLAHAHPSEWQNPPGGKYNLVAIGGGTAGIISALGAAGLGGKAALIERHLLGGDCLNYGCVPSKALLRAARAAYQVGHAGRFGVQGAEGARVDFSEVMQRMRSLRAQISHHDSAQRFCGLGVDVYLGQARFTGRRSLDVEGRRLEFARCVIATGARAARPDVPGLEEAGCLTNETIFSLTDLPRRLAVIGGGPIGCELAQAFRRFGSEVQLIQRAPRLLVRDDPAAAEIIARQFTAEGIVLHLDAKLLRAERTQTGARLIFEQSGSEQSVEADAILAAVGRAPNVEGLDLEAAGVEYGRQGVIVNDSLQTTNRRIYAAGDIAGSYQFTHAADAMARASLQNAFFFGRKRLSRLVVPHATYTDPEVAHVGLTPQQAVEQGIALDSYREEMRNVDRALLDGDNEGFAVVHCRRGTGRIVGATIVAAHAGEMIGEITLLMTNRLPLAALAATIHCYPTQVEVLKRIADQYTKSKLTPTVARILRAVLRWRS